MSDWFFKFGEGRSGNVSLLREYGSHAVCGGIGLEVEFLLEVWLL